MCSQSAIHSGKVPENTRILVLLATKQRQDTREKNNILTKLKVECVGCRLHQRYGLRGSDANALGW